MQRIELVHSGVQWGDLVSHTDAILAPALAGGRVTVGGPFERCEIPVMGSCWVQMHGPSDSGVRLAAMGLGATYQVCADGKLGRGLAVSPSSTLCQPGDNINSLW